MALQKETFRQVGTPIRVRNGMVTWGNWVETRKKLPDLASP